MKRTRGLPAAAISFELTWNGINSSMRSPQLSIGSPIDTQTSVWMKSTPLTAFFGSSVMVMRAPDSLAKSSHILMCSLLGHRSLGAPIRTSMPSLAPTSNSEFAMLLRPSPT